METMPLCLANPDPLHPPILPPVRQPGQAGASGQRGEARQQVNEPPGQPEVLGRHRLPRHQPAGRQRRAATQCQLQDPHGHRQRGEDQQDQGRVGARSRSSVSALFEPVKRKEAVCCKY